MQISWDTGKAASNHQKHGIDFADAATVFDDDYFVSQEDLTARAEQRFTGTGMDAYGRILTVMYTMAERGWHPPDFGMPCHKARVKLLCAIPKT